MKEKFWTAFSSIEEIDSIFVRKLYNYFGDIEAAFNVSKKDFENIKEIGEENGLSEINIKKAEKFFKLRDKIDVDKTWDKVESRGIKVLTFDDSKYPYMLSQIYNPPITLFYKGDLFSCNLEKTVAFVGSRRASTNGKDGVKKIISGLKNTDICIVSGLAEGIDSVSHRAALENNLKTIGVIASGFDFEYPASSRDLYKKLSEGAGAVVTEYYPTFEPIKFRFPQRNRIVTGLSYGTVVGEAAIKSGALISANLTLEQGRELMCVPGSINNKNTEGIYKLLKNGATMVTTSEDVLNALGWQVLDNANNCKQKSDENISKQYLPLWSIISIEPKGFDELQAETGMGTEKLLTLLTAMEVEGLIEQTEGDRYKRV